MLLRSKRCVDYFSQKGLGNLIVKKNFQVLFVAQLTSIGLPKLESSGIVKSNRVDQTVYLFFQLLKARRTDKEQKRED